MSNRYAPRRRYSAALSAIAVLLMSSLSGIDAASWAHADAVKVSKEVGEPLKAATDLAQAGDYKGALAKLDAASAASTSATEKYHIATVRRFIYAKTKDYAKLPPVLDSLIASGLMPDADVKAARRELVQIEDRTGDTAAAMKAAKTYVTTYGHDKEMTIFVAGKALELKDFKAAFEWSGKAIDGERAAGRTAPETWYRIRMKAAYEIKNLDAYYDTVEAALKVYPSETYWRALVSKAHSEPGYSPERLELEEFRVLLAAGVKLTTEEKLGMAEAAFERELSADALAILAPMEANGELKADATKAARNARLLAKAKADTDADRAALKSIVSEAIKSGDGKAIANVADLTMSLGDAKAATELYATALAKPGLDAANANAVRLRLGIAQYKSGDVTGAKKTWSGLKGDDGVPDIARTWQLVAARS
jgi:hypothetical protein